MTYVFVDSVYLLAMLDRYDQWTPEAMQARANLPEDVVLFTTDEVLIELGSLICRGGEEMRAEYSDLVRNLIDEADFKVVTQSRESLEAGLAFFDRRLDKQYSMVDCISMTTMREFGSRHVLTADRHFEQEGFSLLMDR